MITLGPNWCLFMGTWIFLIGIGMSVAIWAVPEGVMKIIAFVVVGWEGLIYLITALKNPGITSAINPHDKTLHTFRNYP
jgi:hypothetical protein